ncbi:hypothetical protein PAPYR_5218 [Paratrimastix pyriformis]|uniref:Telomere length regulation protein conserved domain-containing protein n=1 Tax=Paratrimastix pyriformis TaxID=342808 RepID=A0ABQ8UI86_9EUKA|nr:hypothetical protein PAPYR_5218 [Paratrimastix pyriformis]
MLPADIVDPLCKCSWDQDGHCSVNSFHLGESQEHPQVEQLNTEKAAALVRSVLEAKGRLRELPECLEALQSVLQEEAVSRALEHLSDEELTSLSQDLLSTVLADQEQDGGAGDAADFEEEFGGGGGGSENGGGDDFEILFQADDDDDDRTPSKERGPDDGEGVEPRSQPPDADDTPGASDAEGAETSPGGDLLHVQGHSMTPTPRPYQSISTSAALARQLAPHRHQPRLGGRGHMARASSRAPGAAPSPRVRAASRNRSTSRGRSASASTSPPTSCLSSENEGGDLGGGGDEDPPPGRGDSLTRACIAMPTRDGSLSPRPISRVAQPLPPPADALSVYSFGHQPPFEQIVPASAQLVGGQFASPPPAAPPPSTTARIPPAAAPPRSAGAFFRPHARAESEAQRAAAEAREMQSRLRAMTTLDRFTAGDLLASEHWPAVIGAFSRALGDGEPQIALHILGRLPDLFRAAGPVQRNDVTAALVKHLRRPAQAAPASSRRLVEAFLEATLPPVAAAGPGAPRVALTTVLPPFLTAIFASCFPGGVLPASTAAITRAPLRSSTTTAVGVSRVVPRAGMTDLVLRLYRFWLLSSFVGQLAPSWIYCTSDQIHRVTRHVFGLLTRGVPAGGGGAGACMLCAAEHPWRWICRADPTARWLRTWLVPAIGHEEVLASMGAHGFHEALVRCGEEALANLQAARWDEAQSPATAKIHSEVVHLLPVLSTLTVLLCSTQGRALFGRPGPPPRAGRSSLRTSASPCCASPPIPQPPSPAAAAALPASSASSASLQRPLRLLADCLCEPLGLLCSLPLDGTRLTPTARHHAVLSLLLYGAAANALAQLAAQDTLVASAYPRLCECAHRVAGLTEAYRARYGFLTRCLESGVMRLLPGLINAPALEGVVRGMPGGGWAADLAVLIVRGVEAECCSTPAASDEPNDDLSYAACQAHLGAFIGQLRSLSQLPSPAYLDCFSLQTVFEGAVTALGDHPSWADLARALAESGERPAKGSEGGRAASPAVPSWPQSALLGVLCRLLPPDPSGPLPTHPAWLLALVNLAPSQAGRLAVRGVVGTEGAERQYVACLADLVRIAGAAARWEGCGTEADLPRLSLVTPALLATLLPDPPRANPTLPAPPPATATTLPAIFLGRLDGLYDLVASRLVPALTGLAGWADDALAGPCWAALREWWMAERGGEEEDADLEEEVTDGLDFAVCGHGGALANPRLRDPALPSRIVAAPPNAILGTAPTAADSGSPGIATTTRVATPPRGATTTPGEQLVIRRHLRAALHDLCARLLCIGATRGAAPAVSWQAWIGCALDAVWAHRAVLSTPVPATPAHIPPPPTGSPDIPATPPLTSALVVTALRPPPPPPQQPQQLLRYAVVGGAGLSSRMQDLEATFPADRPVIITPAFLRGRLLVCRLKSPEAPAPVQPHQIGRLADEADLDAVVRAVGCVGGGGGETGPEISVAPAGSEDGLGQDAGAEMMDRDVGGMLSYLVGRYLPPPAAGCLKRMGLPLAACQSLLQTWLRAPPLLLRPLIAQASQIGPAPGPRSAAAMAVSLWFRGLLAAHESGAIYQAARGGGAAGWEWMASGMPGGAEWAEGGAAQVTRWWSELLARRDGGDQR